MKRQRLCTLIALIVTMFLVGCTNFDKEEAEREAERQASIASYNKRKESFANKHQALPHWESNLKSERPDPVYTADLEKAFGPKKTIIVSGSISDIQSSTVGFEIHLAPEIGSAVDIYWVLSTSNEIGTDLLQIPRDRWANHMFAVQVETIRKTPLELTGYEEDDYVTLSVKAADSFIGEGSCIGIDTGTN